MGGPHDAAVDPRPARSGKDDRRAGGRETDGYKLLHNHMMAPFREHNARICVVELCADFDVRIERNKTENRLRNKPSKRDLAASEAVFRTTEARHRLNSNDSDTLPWEEYMKLDNTDLTPDDAAEKIIERFGLEVC